MSTEYTFMSEARGPTALATHHTEVPNFGGKEDLVLQQLQQSSFGREKKLFLLEISFLTALTVFSLLLLPYISNTDD